MKKTSQTTLENTPVGSQNSHVVGGGFRILQHLVPQPRHSNFFAFFFAVLNLPLSPGLLFFWGLYFNWGLRSLNQLPPYELFVLFFKILLFLVFQDRVSVCSSGCPRICSRDQAGLELRVLPAPASWVLVASFVFILLYGCFACICVCVLMCMMGDQKRASGSLNYGC